MKVIFIDIDGVLNSSSGEGPYVSEMEVEKLLLLKKLIDNSGASGIVITSDRRYSIIDINNKLEAFSSYHINVLGELRFPLEDDDEDNRGKQILDYIYSSKEEIEKIVILDDNDEGISNLFFDDFILVNRFYGLNDDVYLKAINILK